MAKKWVLSTETKGTGAEMVPLEKAHGGSGTRAPLIVKPPRPAPERQPEPAAPRRFRVVDVMTRQTLVDDADTRATLAALEGLRSVVDVTVYVWDRTASDWRQLSQRERAALWSMRGRGQPSTIASE